MASKYGQNLIYSEIDPQDSRALRSAMSKLPKEIQTQIRQHNKAQGQTLVDELKRAPQRTPQQKLVEKSIQAKADRDIRVDIGGNKQVGRKYKSRKNNRKYGASAGWLMYGSEHGNSGKTRDRSGRAYSDRFKWPHSRKGYWIAPTIAKFWPALVKDWRRYITETINRAGL